jgi:uncharacterized protein YggT (Ycf19 family)
MNMPATNPETEITRNQRGYGLIGALVSLVFGVILAIVGLRFVFKLLGANPANAIVSWIYEMSEPLVAPFFGIFNADMSVTTGRFELSTLIALVVYAIIAALVTRLFSGGYRTHPV